MDEFLSPLDSSNWAVNLEQLIRQAQDGDEIVVPNRSIQALAELSQWAWYPDKTLVFKLSGSL